MQIYTPRQLHEWSADSEQASAGSRERNKAHETRTRSHKAQVGTESPPPSTPVVQHPAKASA